jgi:hypothetical protein
MLKGAVNNGGDGDEMNIASGEFGDPLTRKRVDVPEWRQISTQQTQMGAEQKLNKPHR